MTDYKFTGNSARILFGLSQDVNAWHTPAGGGTSTLAPAQTIVIQPGDLLKTRKPYDHAELVEITDGDTEKPERPAPTTKAKGARK